MATFMFSELMVLARVGTTIALDMSGDALPEDVKFEFGLLGKLNRFRRMALVSDKQFPRAIAKFLDPFFPSVEIRTFGPDKCDQATAFASELPEAPVEAKHGARMIDTEDPQLAAFELEGPLDEKGRGRHARNLGRFPIALARSSDGGCSEPNPGDICARGSGRGVVGPGGRQGQGTDGDRPGRFQRARGVRVVG
ncbi:MAG: STAS/SEC14 domain-containing protein [Actinomycetia bacterium]|nr:STAS/SEC14 domain-containing protein [Actinomycetes bacterium]